MLFNLSLLHAQKEAAHWYFGTYAGLNFNSGSPRPSLGRLNTREGCASISNGNGALLFYTDGSILFDRNDDLMPNGTNLLGHNSSTQSAIIVPKPGSVSNYFVFTTDNAEKTGENELKKGLNYSEIDMTLNNGYGDVIPSKKNKHLITYNESNPQQKDWKCSEKIAAILHGDGSSYWVVTHFVDTFYAFKVDETGVVETPIKTKVSEVIDIIDLELSGSNYANISALGYLKISPNGKKLIIAHSSTANTKTSGIVLIYDFDSNTGKVSSSGEQILGNTYPYGAEFSRKSKYVYLTANNYATLKGVTTFKSSTVYQFDTENLNITSSKKEIYKSTEILAGALQLAMDGKIYRAKFNIRLGEGENNLASINKPDLNGDLCDYKHFSTNLPTGTQSGYGLPPFMSSFFLFTFDYEFMCFGDATHFFITSDETFDSLVWDFGDGTTSSDLAPTHTYLDPGSYTVTLTTSDNGIPNTPFTKNLQILELANVMDTPFELIECDSNDSDPNDGITLFDLQLAENPISLGNESLVDVYYYLNLTDLNNDVTNELSLPELYTNSSEDQLIYAKVLRIGSDCYTTAEVLLKTSESIEFEAEPIIECNSGNGTAQFDLFSQKEIIISTLNLTADTSTITFHATKNNASVGTAPLNELYTSRSKTIYVRVVNNSICFGIGALNLEVYLFPPIDLEENFDICSSSFPIKINAGIDLNDEANFTFEWNTGDIFSEISITQEGEYNVTITNKSTLCSIIKDFRISTVEKPIIERIEVLNNSTSSTAIIHTQNEGDYLYALNSIFETFQNDALFSNLPPNRYIAYVKDSFNCTTVEKEFYIFGFPKFFTPNNDGVNDLWEIKGLNFSEFTYSTIRIFDRYGKSLAFIEPNSGWDGYFNGKAMSSNDYWFTFNATDSNNITKTYKGHFSLIRK